MARITVSGVTYDVPGLHVHGDTLRVDFNFQGTRIREGLRLPVTKNNVKYGERLISSIKHELAIGTFDYARHFPGSKHARAFSKSVTGIPIPDLFERCLTLASVDLAETTLRNYVASANILCRMLPRKKSNALLAEDIQAIRLDLIKTRTARTVNHYLSVLRRVLAFGYDNKYLTEDLAKHAGHVKIDKLEPKPFTFEEFEQLLAACNHPFDRNLYTIGAYTGLRTGELAALAVEDIDWDRGTLKVKRTITQHGKFTPPKTKTSDGREVVLFPPAMAALRAQLALLQQHQIQPATIEVHLRERNRIRQESCTFLFPTGITGTKQTKLPVVTVGTLNDKWIRNMKRAGLPWRNQYQLRHTFACWMLSHNAPPAFIAAQMGHDDYTMLVTTYGRWMPQANMQQRDQIWQQLADKVPSQTTTALIDQTNQETTKLPQFGPTEMIEN